MFSLAARSQAYRGVVRRFSDAVAKPVRKSVSMEERAANRAARKERASKFLAQARGTPLQDGSASIPAAGRSMLASRWVWYAGVAVPAGLIFWGYNDETSPPSRFSEAIGLTDWISGWTDQFAQPSHEKLLPDWSQMPNVPQDIPIPPTLVLDLESTLVCSTWDRKHGWRHAKRPGVDKFLHDMAQYYEIVLYSPSIDGVADPIVNSLDKSGCIMHRLYRDATHYKNGIHLKNLDNLNRNVNKMIIIDDDPEEVAMHPDNLIRVKPYVDPNDFEDDTLEKITPFLIEIAREGYNNVPAILRQYRGMDADEIAAEHERRIQQFKMDRLQKSHRGLGGLARHGLELPPPEMTPVPQGATQQLTSKDLVGAAPPPQSGGMMNWMNQRAKEKEEEQMRKMEKWQEVMIKKQQAKKAAEQKQVS